MSKSNHSEEVKSTDPAVALVRQISQARLMAIRKKRSNLTKSYSTQDNGKTYYTLERFAIKLLLLNLKIQTGIQIMPTQGKKKEII